LGHNSGKLDEVRDNSGKKTKQVVKKHESGPTHRKRIKMTSKKWWRAGNTCTQPLPTFSEHWEPPTTSGGTFPRPKKTKKATTAPPAQNSNLNGVSLCSAGTGARRHPRWTFGDYVPSASFKPTFKKIQFPEFLQNVLKVLKKDFFLIEKCVSTYPLVKILIPDPGGQCWVCVCGLKRKKERKTDRKPV
jgi:hypothetical protein